jgi:hypothetical protein
MTQTCYHGCARDARHCKSANYPRAISATVGAGLWLLRLAVGPLVLAVCLGSLQAANIAIPNWSFESPVTTLATPLIDSWQQVPPPDFINSDFRSGVFSNPPPADPFHIDNCDGNQAIFLFATNQTAVFQDYDSTDYANPTPTHAFDATFDVGKSYALTVAVLGGTNLAYPMQEGTTLELSLYYRDDASNKVTAAAITVTNTTTIFSNATHFTDFEVRLSTVRSSDPWAGRHIGIQLLSTGGVDFQAGYWDLDNVRLASVVTPSLLGPVYTNGQFTFTLQSEPGSVFDILAATNSALPLTNWSAVGRVTNTTGITAFSDPAAGFSHRLYRARQLQ